MTCTDAVMNSKPSSSISDMRLTSADRTAQQEHDDVLDLSDVVGKRVIDTRLLSRITIREENAATGLEVMSRFAI